MAVVSLALLAEMLDIDLVGALKPRLAGFQLLQILAKRITKNADHRDLTNICALVQGLIWLRYVAKKKAALCKAAGAGRWSEGRVVRIR